MKLENPSVTGVEAGGAPAVIRTKLSNATLVEVPSHVSRFGYDRSRLRPGIVHIGVGNFFRAHEALYVDRCLHLPGQEAWAIVGVGLGDGPGKKEKAEAIRSQDGLYTLTEYSPDGTVSTRVIGSLIEYLHAPAETEAVFDRLASPDTRIVSLTITEGGYNIDETTKEFVLAEQSVQHDLTHSTTPKTAFGFIVEGLARRCVNGLNGLTVLSCDNLRSNGDVARTAVLAFARARDATLASWIEEHVSFPNSMVDRIAPSVGRAERARANAQTGVEDETPVIGESFTQWVMEDEFIAGRPAFDQVGVQLRNDVEKFEAIKGRLLNASHMMLSYPALMCGYRLVDEALRQPAIAAYLDAFMDKDVIPLLKGPDGVSLEDYKRQILERFANPAIGDQLLRIAQNGIAKLPVFLSKTLSELLDRGGAFERVALCLACFEHYLHGHDLQGSTFPVDEPHLTTEDKALLQSQDPLAVLKLSPFKALQLFADDVFIKAFLAARKHLASRGPVAALRFAAEA